MELIATANWWGDLQCQRPRKHVYTSDHTNEFWMHVFALKVERGLEPSCQRKQWFCAEEKPRKITISALGTQSFSIHWTCKSGALPIEKDSLELEPARTNKSWSLLWRLSHLDPSCAMSSTGWNMARSGTVEASVSICVNQNKIDVARPVTCAIKKKYHPWKCLRNPSVHLSDKVSTLTKSQGPLQ